MISQSFLRNLSHKNIQCTTEIQKNKLKVFYTKAIKSALSENRRNIIYSRKSQRGNSKNQSVNHQDMNGVLFKYVKQKQHSFDNNLHKGKEKTPIHFIDLKFLSPKFTPKQTTNNTDKQQTPLNTWRNLKLQNNGSKLKKETKTVRTQRHNLRSSHRKNTAETHNTQSKDDKLFSPKVSDLQLVKEQQNYCLQNYEILRCLSADSSYVIKRKQSIKNSFQRGEIFKKTIKRKFGKFSKKKIEINTN